MVHTLPPLEWAFGCGDCMSRALGCSVATVVKPTVNPLLYTVKYEFGEQQSGPQKMRLWNLVQQWAHKNESVPQGHLELDDRTMVVTVVVKRRLGPPRDASPLG